MPAEMPVDQLSRAMSSDPTKEYPDEIRVIAKWMMTNPKTGADMSVSRHFIITRDEFFGRGQHGAPMNGDRIMQQINALRKSKPQLKEIEQPQRITGLVKKRK